MGWGCGFIDHVLTLEGNPSQGIKHCEIRKSIFTHSLLNEGYQWPINNEDCVRRGEVRLRLIFGFGEIIFLFLTFFLMKACKTACQTSPSVCIPYSFFIHSILLLGITLNTLTRYQTP